MTEEAKEKEKKMANMGRYWQRKHEGKEDEEGQ